MSEVILYKTPNKDIKVEILLENETIWLSQQKIAELFDTTKQNISLHVKNIFESGELDENSVVKDFLTTAAEIINQRASSTKPNMGLTSWKNSPHGAIRKSDVTIAKNYLSADELDMYNRIVEMYLNFAEFQAKNKKIMSQKDWIEKLNGFLTMNDREILQDKGKVTAKLAEQLAISEYEKYKIEQDQLYVSDFDKLVQKVGKDD